MIKIFKLFIFTFITTNMFVESAISCTEYGESYLSAAPGKNAILLSDHCIYSPNRQYFLAMQGDGNLVMYRVADNPSQKPEVIFFSDTVSGIGVYQLAMQKDGNLVVYKGSNPKIGDHIWDTKTYGIISDYFLNVQDDGNVVVYRGIDPTLSKGPIWSWRYGKVNKKIVWKVDEAPFDLYQTACTGGFGEGGDRSDVSIKILTLANSKCGHSNYDNEPRARRLLRYTEALVKACKTSDYDFKLNAANNLHFEIYSKSKMYKSCWKTIKNINVKVGKGWSF